MSNNPGNGPSWTQKAEVQAKASEKQMSIENYRKLAEHVEGAEQFPKPQKMSKQPILGRLDRITTC